MSTLLRGTRLMGVAPFAARRVLLSMPRSGFGLGG